MSAFKVRAKQSVFRPLAWHARRVAMASMAGMSKKEGDISSVFVSLSGGERKELPSRFRDLKLALVAGHEKEVVAGWNRLLDGLLTENETVAARGPSIIPTVQFDNIDSDLESARGEIQKRGAAVVRGVVPEQEARAYKSEVEEYVGKNPGTRGESSHDKKLSRNYYSSASLTVTYSVSGS